MPNGSYIWQKGDDLRKIAAKFTGDPFNYPELLDLNKDLLKQFNYIMRQGDVIEIPEHWATCALGSSSASSGAA